MAQKRRPSYLDYGKDGGDALNRSWDVESRYRLQEKVLGLPNGEDGNNNRGGGLFRAQVELGLHELTAAMSSLSRRIDKLESNTAPPEREKQDEAVKELARNARCLSQALTGIASARTRRRALHGFFHESDEQRVGCGDRIDPAARALIVEGLSCLAGKLRPETVRGSGHTNGGGLALSRSNTSHGSSPPRRRRSTSPRRFFLQKNGAAMGDGSEQGVDAANASFDARDGGGGGGGARETGSGSLSVRELSQPRAYAKEGSFSPGKLEVEQLRGFGPSVPPSPITITGPVDGKMFPPAPAMKKAEEVSLGVGEVERARDQWQSERIELAPSNGRRDREKSRSGADTDGRRNGGCGGAKHPSIRKTGRSPSTRIAPNAAISAAAGANTVVAAAKNSVAGNGRLSASVGGGGGNRRSTSSALGDFGGKVEASAKGVGSTVHMLASAGPTAAVAASSAGPNKSSTNLNNSKTPGLVSAAHASRGAVSSGHTAGGRGDAWNQDLMARMLLDAAGLAAEAEQKGGGPRMTQAGRGLEERDVHIVGVGGGGGLDDTRYDGGGGGDSFRQEEVMAVKALSSRVRRSAALSSSSSASSSSSSSTSSSSMPSRSLPAAAAAAATAATATAAAAASAASVAAAAATAVGTTGAVIGGSGANRAALSKPAAETSSRRQPRTSSAKPRRRRSTLDMLQGGKGNPQVAERRPSLSSDMWASLDAGVGAPLTDAQGFVDSGAASADGASWARLAQARRPDTFDPRVAELEAKLQELRRIGDEIKEQAAATTAEPSLTIPTQDLSALSPWFQHARRGNSTPGSLRPPSSSRHRRHDTTTRGGGARSGLLAAAAPSAFTSAEPSPSRPAEIPPSTTAAPPPVPPHGPPGGMSGRSAPPFSSAVLRNDVVASLERHLSEYRENGKGGVKGGCPGEDNGCVGDGGGGKDCGGGNSGNGGGGNGGDGIGSGSGVRGDSGETAACDLKGKKRSIGGSGCDGEDRKGDGARPQAPAATSTAVEMPELNKKAVEARRSETEETETAAVEMGGVGGASGKEESGQEMEEEPDEDTAPGEAETGAKKTTNWAQEYHDYLCSKDG